MRAGEGGGVPEGVGDISWEAGQGAILQVLLGLC